MKKIGCFCQDELTLEYQYEKLRRSQGYLVFGKSGCMMEIPAEQLKQAGITLEKTKLVKENYLTKWLLDGEVPDAQEKWPAKKTWLRAALKNEDLLAIGSNSSAVQNAAPNGILRK